MPTLKLANINWQQNIPYAKDFNEIYHSSTDGLAKSRFVFCDAISNNDEWWQRQIVSLGETGFGIGLNFLTSWQKWRKLAPNDSELHFVSAEAFPLSRDDLAKALSNWPELKEFADALIAKYPVLHPGFHRLYFNEDRVSLTLLIGDAAQMFEQLHASIDGWYLDGFDPAINPDMWSPQLCRQLARLSYPGTKLATFSASDTVCCNLKSAGFLVEKTCGFAQKPEGTSGVYGGKSIVPSLPWFAPTAPAKKKAKIAIIGGGIAGVNCYHATLRAGFNPTLFEREADPARGGSGNPVGLIQPRLTISDSMDGQFNATAYLHSIRFYDSLSEKLGERIWHGNRGGIQLARNDTEALRYKKLVQETRLPQDEMLFLSAGELSQKAGVPVSSSGLFYPNAGALLPRELVTCMTKNMNIVFNANIYNLRFSDDQWLLMDEKEQIIASSDIVILANAHEATRLADIRDLPLTAKRGQTSFLPVSSLSKALKCGLSFGNYVTPAFKCESGQECHVVGASYRALSDHERFEPQAATLADHKENIDSLALISSSFEVESFTKNPMGRASVRATTVDHLAVMGPVHSGDEVDEIYHDLRHGKPTHLYPTTPYQKGLYCLTGLGSRGFQTAPLLATALADMLAGCPNILERRFLDAVHPVRFQIRKLKRKK